MPIDIEQCKLLIQSAAAGDLARFEELLARDDVDVNYSPRVLQHEEDEDGDWDWEEDEDEDEEEELEEDAEDIEGRDEIGPAQENAIAIPAVDDMDDAQEDEDEDEDEEVIAYAGTALYHAIENGHEEISRRIIDHPDLDINACDPSRAVNANAICHAIAKKSKVIVEYLLARGADVHALSFVEKLGRHVNALGHAVVAQDLELVGVLLDHKNTNLHHASNKSIAQCAIVYSNIDVLNILLDKGAEVNEPDHLGVTPLECAIFRSGYKSGLKYMDFCDALLRNGAKMTFTVYLLMNDEARGFLDENKLSSTLVSLIANGFDIDFKGKFGFTPIMVAAANGYGDAARMLIEKGADITAVNQFGKTPVTMAIQFGNSMVLERLLLAREERLAADRFLQAVDHGDVDAVREVVKLRQIDVNNTDKDGKAALAIVCQSDHLEMVKIVLEKYIWANRNSLGNACVRAPGEILPDIDAMDNLGDTALANACQRKNFSMADFLLKNGADVNARDSAGVSILAKACASKSLDSARYLLEHGADVNARDVSGNTILGNSCFAGNFVAADFLMQNKADIDLKNHSGQTALMLSCVNAPSPYMVNLLLNYGADIQVLDDSGCSVFDYLARHQEMFWTDGKYFEVKRLLEGRRWQTQEFVDDENLNFSFNEHMANPLPVAWVRGRFVEQDDDGEKRPYFGMQEDADDLVQLPCASPLLSGMQMDRGEWSHAAIDFSLDGGAAAVMPELACHPGAASYHEL